MIFQYTQWENILGKSIQYYAVQKFNDDYIWKSLMSLVSGANKYLNPSLCRMHTLDCKSILIFYDFFRN